MATIKEDFIQHLLDQTAITDEVSTRVHPNKSPQEETNPRIVVRGEGADPEHHLRGASTLMSSTLSVQCLADTEKGAADLGDIVRLAIDGFKGTMNSNAVVRLAKLSDIRDTDEGPTAGDEVGYPSVTLKFEIKHRVGVGSLIA